MSVLSPSSTKKGPGRRHQQGQRRSFARSFETGRSFDDYRMSLNDADSAVALEMPVMRGVTQAPKRVTT